MKNHLYLILFVLLPVFFGCNPGKRNQPTSENPFSIYRPLGKAAIKAFYYQRAGMPIEEKYAGKWHRSSGHPDTIVFIHPSAASAGRPAGTIISSPGGWYDAGDYNKYIVNSGFTVGLLMALAEDASDYIETLNLNIPESDNDTPDLLDEIYYNLAWMLTMQDPADGGVYHKLTTPHFEGFIQPDKCRQQRYVVQKSVTATLDFSSSMAQASRVFRNYAKDYPGFSDKALAAAQKAYEWALMNPEAYYNQDEINKNYEPAVITGAYGDNNSNDEFYWAAVELFSTTGEKKYMDDMKRYQPAKFTLPTWGAVAGLGYMTLLRNSPCKENFETVDPEYYKELKQQLLDYCNKSVNLSEDSLNHIPFGNRAEDFGWGCLSEKCANQTVAFFYAYQLTGNKQYLNYGINNNDYILGRNPLGYCYVTGFGTKNPMYPHHRLSASDDIEEPIPGFLVGGPNPAQQDKSETLIYPSNIPAESYIDDEESYASNEIAINWNASLSYISVMTDALVEAINNNIE